MARYVGSQCRLSRREGEKLFLKGIRCDTVKCAITKRKYPPGQFSQPYGTTIVDKGWYAEVKLP